MGERRTVMAVAMLAGVATAMLSGCAPQPAPTYTPTPASTIAGFSSDEEAFAAAEATYRAYVDALNDQNAGRNGPDPLEFLVGPAREDEVAAAKEFESLEIRLVGEIWVQSFEVRSASNSRLDAVVCLDVSHSQVINAGGEDVTPVERQDVLGLDVEFRLSPGAPRISNSSANEVSC